MTIAIVTPPDATKPPILAGLLKQHLSILPAETDFDQILEMYLDGAVDEFTSRTGKAIISQVVRQSFDCFPCEDYFLLERSPVIAFTKIEYRNSSGAWVELPSTVYQVDGDNISPIVQLKDQQVWPVDIHCSMLNSVRCTYTVGFGTDETDVPMGVKRILSMLCGDSHLHREDTVVIPGATQIVVTLSSYASMRRYFSNYFEHRSQKRR